MSAHTPGPWTQIDQLVVVQPPEHDYSTWIANASVGGESRATQIANARLIAAAPDLLAAGQAALQLMEQLNRGIGARDGTWQEVDLLRAAIAKATSTP